MLLIEENMQVVILLIHKVLCLLDSASYVFYVDCSRINLLQEKTEDKKMDTILWLPGILLPLPWEYYVLLSLNANKVRLAFGNSILEILWVSFNVG